MINATRPATDPSALVDPQGRSTASLPPPSQRDKDQEESP